MKKIIQDRNNQETGQIIVLLAISLVVVLIVAALAVDGGMIYSERRFAQNAADASSLAGAGIILHSMEELDGDTGEREVTSKYFLCPSESSDISEEVVARDKLSLAIEAAKTKAIEVADLNNFPKLPYLGLIEKTDSSEDDDIIGDHGIVIECVNQGDDKYINVDVRISSQISTAFAHLIFPGPLRTSNIAVTQVEPRRNIGWGNAIISLSEECQNNTDGMEFTGTGDIAVYGGNIHSNSCLIGSGNISVMANPIYNEIGEIIGYDEGSITLNDETEVLNGGAEIFPDPEGSVEIKEVDPLDGPNCDLADPISGNTYQTGEYPSGIKITNGTWQFEPGTYCLTGDLEITGGTVTGYGVFFFMDEGDVRITGNASVKLTAPIDPDPWAGMLIYMDEDNPGLITLVGTDQSLFSGTVFAPTGNIEVGGTSDGTTLSDCSVLPMGVPCTSASFSVQLIGNYVKVVGTSVIDILFDETSNFYVVGNLFLLE